MTFQFLIALVYPPTWCQLSKQKSDQVRVLSAAARAEGIEEEGGGRTSVVSAHEF